MTFDSIHFILFFLGVVPLYYFLPYHRRVLFLLVASCYFYMVFVPAYVLILFFLIVLDFFLAPHIEQSEGKRRGRLLTLSIFANLSTLFFFKYFNFFNDNVATVAHFVGWNYSVAALRILLPLGLSFHVFQSLSYVVEVYKGKQSAEKSFTTYALYVMFFPQLVAGPIERPQHLLPQLHALHPFDYTNFRAGLERMLWGFFKKIVIANAIAPIVTMIYNYPTQYTGFPLAIATVLFGVQLYADFSGYSDIAIGSARVLGIRLSENFNNPYLATSIGDFWRRWHISLSSWLRDYLYYPIVFFRGARLTPRRLYLASLVTFTLIGLWHGAAWTYVAMGALHGVYLSFGAATQNFRRRFVSVIRLTQFPRAHVLFQMCITNLLVLVGWVFFRARSMNDAWYIFTHLLLPSSFSTFTHTYQLTTVQEIVVRTFGSYFVFWSISIPTICVFVCEYLWGVSPFDGVQKYSPWIRWTSYGVVLIGLLFFGYFGTSPFIYFQF